MQSRNLLKQKDEIASPGLLRRRNRANAQCISSLPFKGRAGVEMGVALYGPSTHLAPNPPLKGEELDLRG